MNAKEARDLLERLERYIKHVIDVHRDRSAIEDVVMLMNEKDDLVNYIIEITK